MYLNDFKSKNSQISDCINKIINKIKIIFFLKIIFQKTIIVNEKVNKINSSIIGNLCKKKPEDKIKK